MVKPTNGRIILKRLFILIILILALSGCGKATREVLTRDHLAGKKVGVMAGYSTDYILTDSRYDLDIYRYDAYADMQLALKYHRIDAAAMERDEADVFCRVEPDYKIAFTMLKQIDFAYQFHSDRHELMAQFNDFIDGFKRTETYRDIIRRIEAVGKAPYVSKKVKNKVASNRVIKVAIFDGWEPVSYKNRSTDEWEGADVELITHFANSMGAKVEFKEMGWNQMLIELGSGRIDLLLNPSTLKMTKDFQLSKSIIMSEPVFKKDMVVIVYKGGE